MSKDKPKRDDPRKEVKGGNAGRSSGGSGRDRPAKGYGATKNKPRNPPPPKPETR